MAVPLLSSISFFAQTQCPFSLSPKDRATHAYTFRERERDSHFSLSFNSPISIPIICFFIILSILLLIIHHYATHKSLQPISSFFLKCSSFSSSRVFHLLLLSNLSGLWFPYRKAFLISISASIVGAICLKTSRYCRPFWVLVCPDDLLLPYCAFKYLGGVP